MGHVASRHSDTMLRAYIEAALWSTTDESTPDGGEPLDKNYGPEDIAQATLEAMRHDVTAFAETYAEQLEGSWDRAGLDLWLTRNGLGAGFWDGDWPEPAATVLTDAAEALGEFCLYVGNNGELCS